MPGFLKKILKAAMWAGVAVVGLAAGLALANVAATAWEARAYKAPGRMVEVDGGRMHVWTTGEGTRNVVFLSGLGTTGPVEDFAPLARALSGDARVTVVEYFGYGWSDRTSKPRTARAIVDETRAALAKAGVNAPYVLVPHSISGLYALLWANAHPEEVEGVVGIDTSVPGQGKYATGTKAALTPLAVARALGILRIQWILDPSRLGPRGPEYTAEDRMVAGVMDRRNSGNAVMADEFGRVAENAGALAGAVFPPRVPVRFLLSAQTIAATPRAMPGLDWKGEHEALVEGNIDGGIEVLDGPHYLQWTGTPRLAENIAGFLRSLPQ